MAALDADDLLDLSQLSAGQFKNVSAVACCVGSEFGIVPPSKHMASGKVRV